jgi:hypothetical protein
MQFRAPHSVLRALLMVARSAKYLHREEPPGHQRRGVERRDGQPVVKKDGVAMLLGGVVEEKLDELLPTSSGVTTARSRPDSTFGLTMRRDGSPARPTASARAAGRGRYFESQDPSIGSTVPSRSRTAGKS